MYATCVLAWAAVSCFPLCNVLAGRKHCSKLSHQWNSEFRETECVRIVELHIQLPSGSLLSFSVHRVGMTCFSGHIGTKLSSTHIYHVEVQSTVCLCLPSQLLLLHAARTFFARNKSRIFLNFKMACYCVHVYQYLSRNGSSFGFEHHTKEVRNRR